ncbi:MAG: Crp/Fnr family transcriptional regulator, partial [Thermoanaerobaculia bacterium]
GFTADFFADNAGRAAWLRHLRACLARRLSRLNDLFRGFFPSQGLAAALPLPAGGDAASLSPEEKSRSLSSGGLSASDRFLFAAFAEERRYPAEAVIFREGDAGDALYAVAQGRVRISRQLAGGEEAFAILPPGEIFGEMAILDPESPGRSADARAHEETVLLALARSRFEKLERSDPEGCADLSALLCRLAARRCVETAERLARWRMMAGPG